MKAKTAVVIIVFLLVFIVPAHLSAQTDTQILWKKVGEAQEKGLPQTAIDNLNVIYKIANANKRYGESLKAIGMKIVLEANIKGNKPEVKVNLLKEEIRKADSHMKPLMKTMLAQWYWHYYSRNKYRFIKRTKTAGIQEDDFTTWDLPKLFSEISAIYQDLLKDEEVLKKIKIAEFKDVLDMGNLPHTLRPTLFDFLAYKGLEFYTSGEQVGAKPEDAFIIEAHSKAFDEARNFIEYSPNTTDINSPRFHSIKIYQKILRFHIQDPDPDAFLDADISRLNYVFNNASGENKSEIYITRMREITKRYPKSPYSSLAYYHWAQQIHTSGDYVEAYSVAKKGKELHPNSYGGLLCAQLINTITAKELNIKTERVVATNNKWKVRVNYRNIDTVTFQVVKDNWKEYLSTYKYMSSPTDDELEKFLKKEPVFTFTAILKPTVDYKTKSATVELAELPAGFYRIFASYKKDFSKDGNSIQQSFLWVSNIAVVMREQNAIVEGLVLNSTSGEPIKGATVKLYAIRNYNEKEYTVRESTNTDENGWFQFNGINRDEYWRVRIYANDNKGSEYFDPQDLYPNRAHEQAGYKSVVFFTDRSIYRPGQMIHFKGIVIDVDAKTQNYNVIPRQKVTVRFKDVNGQEIANTTVNSNDFGSFSGTFTAPTDRLAGSMSLVSDYPSGSCQIRVEEYKRPKFTVMLKVPEQSFRLNDEVPVTGEAIAYTGAPVDGAKVAYRVVREIKMPYWWYYYWHDVSYDAQEIAHGTASTDVSGKFVIRFNAKPDERVSKKDQPVFIFRVYADVTDNAGETRSDEQCIRLGYTAMEATLSAGEWQVENLPVSISINTATLDGKLVDAKGSVEIFGLRQPEKPVRSGVIESDDSVQNPGTWPLGEKVTQGDFATSVNTQCVLKFKLKAGPYKALLTSQDRYGNKVTAQLPFIVLDPSSKTFPVKISSFFKAKSTVVEVGETFESLWGTGYESGRAFVEILQNNRPLKKYWTEENTTQQLIKLLVDETKRGGFTVFATYVRENRLYTHRIDVMVPWTNKKFDVTLETFRSKLLPGQDETWTIKVKGPGAEKKAAEFVATLYDESLDAFLPHNWQTLMRFFGQNYTSFNQRFSNDDQRFSPWITSWQAYTTIPKRQYVNFIYEIIHDFYGYEYSMKAKKPSPGFRETNEAIRGMEEKEMASEPMTQRGSDKAKNGVHSGKGEVVTPPPPPAKMDIQARKNFNETAFFYPHLLSDKDGSVKITFKMPEALTKWHFMALAHGKGMESGSVDGHTVTQKELMVQPNPPRFFREGDILDFSVKVTNMVEKELKGTVRLTFFQPGTDQSLDHNLSNNQLDRDIEIPAKQSRSYSWKIIVPDGLKIVGFKAMASAGDKKDGEEGVIPILCRRIFVAESIPLWVRGPAEKKFTFEKLVKSKESYTLVNEGFTVQVASNPTWYAVQALPFLMEFPHECSEQVFNRLYANAVGRKIANSDPKIRTIFNKWKEEQPDALLSNLEKNEQLKSVMLLETPWVVQAKSESAVKRNIGILFDETRMNGELKSAYYKLKNMQYEDGAWPWFPGGYPNTYITLYITTGFGRMKHLNLSGVEYDCALKSLDYLDRWILQVYRDILKHGHNKDNNLSSSIAFYLYGRSFFISLKPIPQESKVAVDYFLEQAKKYWLKLDYRMSQTHLALALWRFGDKSTAKDIMTSIKERSQTDDEMGMFWSELEHSWWWFRAPIETQALMIEAFDEIMNDQKSVEDCKVWLLKQKQTQDWKTTKATSDAVYGLLCRGENILAGDAIVEVTLGGTEVKPEKVEAGTGFYEKRFEGKDVLPQFGEIVMKKDEKGIAWGGAYWQYLEDISKVTPHVQNPLKLKKTVFIQRNTKSGPVIEPVTGSLEVGDLLKIRIELRVDRDMEYVHLRDERGSGLEPLNFLSQYKYQDGLRYYESTKDTASHFYIDYLPKGTYVFEYPLRVVNRGEYQNGLAHIECMYAPEFNSHSDSVKLVVK